MVLHAIELALRYADRVVVLSDGQIVADRPAGEALPRAAAAFGLSFWTDPAPRWYQPGAADLQLMRWALLLSAAAHVLLALAFLVGPWLFPGLAPVPPPPAEATAEMVFVDPGGLPAPRQPPTPPPTPPTAQSSAPVPEPPPPRRRSPSRRLLLPKRSRYHPSPAAAARTIARQDGRRPTRARAGRPSRRK